MEHTQECEQLRQRWEAVQQAYDDNWPNACHKCNAWGIEVSFDNAAPHGSGEYWPMRVDEECDDCIGQGKCPRCGSLLFEDAGEKYNELWEEWFSESKSCPICGWTWGEKAGDVRPDDFECWCWLPDSDDEYKEEMG